MKPHILVVDDEENIRFTFRRFLEKQGYEVSVSEGFDEACCLLQNHHFDLTFVDLMLGGKSGLDLTRELRQIAPTTPVVLITGAPSVETASSALRLGAYDYITKPVRQDALIRVAQNALRLKQANDEKEEYRRNFEAIMRSVKEAIITCDTQGRITQANPAALEICGIGPGHRGQPMISVGNGYMAQCLPLLEQTLKTRRPSEMQRIQCLRSEQTRIVSVSISPLNGPGDQILGAVLIVRDDTALNNLENRIKKQPQFQGLVGRSAPMQRLYELIDELASLPSTVLISGESGTGKELVAEALHFRGNRHDRPLVKLNCAALPENLLESELFGHVRGAFTGAVKDKKGRFEMAHGGTIFLDEIGDISPALQVRLLRVLQEREIERVGEGVPRKVDVRIIAATHQDLVAKVARGTFREDLLYRLKVVHLELPPLRNRTGDLPLLTEFFINQLNKRLSKEVLGLSKEAMEVLSRHSWPGNIRELEHVLENAMVHCRQASILDAEHLSLGEVARQSPPPVAESDATAFLDALRRTDWNKAKAARLLGISRPTLYRKIEQYDLEK